jgi:hypothetical protein
MLQGGTMNSPAGTPNTTPPRQPRVLCSSALTRETEEPREGEQAAEAGQNQKWVTPAEGAERGVGEERHLADAQLIFRQIVDAWRFWLTGAFSDAVHEQHIRLLYQDAYAQECLPVLDALIRQAMEQILVRVQTFSALRAELLHTYTEQGERRAESLTACMTIPNKPAA